MSTINLISPGDQIRLTASLIRDEFLKPSLVDRILAVLTFPFCCIASFFENLAWRLVDPNWRAFVAKSQGHFVYEKHKKTFSEALNKMDEIFSSIIHKSPDTLEWHLVYNNMKSAQNRTEETWKRFSQYGGSCFGNSLTLASSILNAKRILTVDELKKIEKTDIFVKTAQTAQLIMNTAHECNRTINDNGLSEINKITDQTKKLQKLGLTLEEYESSPYKGVISSIMAHNIEKSDLGSTTFEDLSKMSPLSRAVNFTSLKKNVQQRQMLKPGLEVINQFELLPSQSKGKVLTIKPNDFENFKLTVPDFKGIVMIGGRNAELGHAMLLEVDNEKGVYILYDNNRGFYQWNDFQVCLTDLKKRFLDEGYQSIQLTESEIQI